MNKFNRSYKLLFSTFLFIQAIELMGQFGTPVADPVEDIPRGDLAIELEDWVTIPQSSGGTPRAKLSVFRTTPDGRLWVNDQRGKLWQIIDNEPVEYFDIDDLITQFIDSPGLGTGFHSFAFHPEFMSNGKFYTTHTEGPDAEVPDFTGKAATSKGQQGVIMEWTVADPAATEFSGSSRELLRIQFPGNIHCLQEINFRPASVPGDEDYGLLYICVGDGGSYNEGFPDNTHRLDSPFGAVLRIDPMGNNSANGKYGNPETNPWAADGDPETLAELYAYGFRNPHRLTWDRGGDGIGLLGTIGETTIEEVNLLIPGADYGWPVREGTFVIDPYSLADRDKVYPLPEDDADYGFTYPVAQYDHDDGFAIVGGYVYRGAAIPELYGKYVFGDIKNGRVFYLDAADLELGKQAPIYTMVLTQFGQETTLPALVGRDRADLRFGEDLDGELYIMTKTDGKIRKVVQSEGPSGVLDPNPEDFRKVANFELQDEPVDVPEGQARVVNDPYSGSLNTVLSVDPDGPVHVVDLADGIPAGGAGTLYFRFAMSDDGTVSAFGFADTEQPTSEFSLGGLFKIGDEGELSGRDRLSMKSAGVRLEAGQWYEAWLVWKTGEFSYELHLLGADWTAPTLVSGPLSTLTLSPKEVRTFTMRPNPSSTGSLFFDDFYLDDRDLNFSSPVDSGYWRLVSNLEESNSPEGWSIWGTGGQPGGILDIQTEANGNRIAAVDFGSDGNATTLIHDFPLEIDVSGTVTLFARVNPEFSEGGERLGIRSIGSEQELADAIDENLEAYVRFMRMAGSDDRTILVRDAADEVEATMPGSGEPIVFTVDPGWIDVWLVLRNGGRASGGQTYDVYLGNAELGPDPILAAENVEFNQGQEVPLLSAVVHAGPEGQRLYMDDAFIAIGEKVARPVNLGDELFPNALGEKNIPWFGQINDFYQDWILHETHGWLYVEGADQGSGTWLLDESLGWLFLDSQSYPNVYSNTMGWLYYLTGSASPRWFYRYDTDSWMEN